MNLELVSDAVAIWLKQANDGHYYIERWPKRHDSSANKFPISIKFAEQLQTMSSKTAFITIERYLGVAPC